MTVYLIRAGDGGPVKIGWAKDAEARRRYLQIGHHETLRLIRVIDGVRLLERWLQEHFAALRVRGEWFRFDPDMLAVEAPDLTGWLPTPMNRAARGPRDGLASLRADLWAYLDNGSPALAATLAGWIVTA